MILQFAKLSALFISYPSVHLDFRLTNPLQLLSYSCSAENAQNALKFVQVRFVVDFRPVGLMKYWELKR